VAAGARNVLRKPPNPAGNVLHVLLLLPVMLLLFHAAVLPWQPVVLIGRIPLLEFLLIAMIAGYTTAYWLPRSLPILRTKEKKPPADHKHTEKKRSDNLEAAQGTLIILAVLILLAIAAVGNGAHADGRRGAFADAYASVILDQMGSRQWLATDGRIDHHLRILAAVRNQPLHLVNLSDEHHPIQIRQLLRMIDAEPEMQPLRYRLRNAATLGAMAFIQEWLVSDSQADASLLLYEMPELWNETGRQAQPDRLLFAGTHSLDALRIVPLLKAQRLVWDDMDAIVFTASNSMDTLDAFRQELRQHLSLMANTLGLLLEDLGRPEEAYEAYDRALVFAPANVSAILNRLALIRQGMHTEDQNEAEQTAAAALATLKSAVPINRISRVYGCVRESAAFAAQATDWARQHQTGLAILCMQRAIELAPAAEKSAYRHRLAALLLEQGNIVQSEAMYRAFLLTDAADRNAVLSLLRIAIGRQDATEAHRWLDQARHAGVPESTLAAEDAAVDIVAGDLEKARRKLLALTDQHSENVQTWATLASVLIKQGEIGEVERFVLPQMQRASRKGATHPLYYLTFGLVQKAKGAGCHAAARQAFRQALALCPDWRYLQEDILRLDLALCDNDAAEQDAGKLLLWNRNHSSANYVMGVLRLKQGRIEESEDYLRRSVATQGTAQAWNTLAEVLRLRRTLPEAEQAARQSLARDAKNAATWDTLACVLLDANRQREAREAIETARRLDLDNPRVQLTAARILARSGQWVAARDALRQVSAKSKELPVKVREDLTALATEIGRQ